MRGLGGVLGREVYSGRFVAASHEFGVALSLAKMDRGMKIEDFFTYV